jgi:hypothetical protein
MKTLSTQNRGLFFDAAVLMANLLLLPPLIAFVRQTQGAHPIYAFLLLSAVICHALGASLKRQPLHERLAKTSRPEPSTAAYIGLFTLCVMHCGLFMAAMSFALEIFFEDRGIDLSPFVSMILVMGGAAIPTCLTIRSLIPPAQFTPAIRFQEEMADVLLFISLIILFAWWEGSFLEEAAGKAQGSWLAAIVLTSLLSVPFAIFYLAPRLLYLIEDYRRAATWIQIYSVMLPVVWRVL